MNERIVIPVKKTKISLILASMILLSAASCGTQEEPISGTTESVYETTEAVTEPAIPEPELPEANWDGADFTFLIRGRYSGNFEEVFLIADSLNGETVNDAIFNRNLAVEERFNVNLNFIEDPDADITCRNLVMSDDPSVDVVDQMATKMGTLATGGCLENLLDMKWLNLDAEYWSPYAAKDLQLNGKLYMMISDLSMGRLEYARLLYFNSQMIEDFDLVSPYEQAENNNWTLDTFLNYLNEVSADLNGDGVYDRNDRFGMLRQDGTNGDLMYLLIGSGIMFAEHDAEKGLVVSAFSEKTQSIMERVASVFKTGNATIDYQTVAKGADYSGFDNLYEWARLLFNEGKFLFLPCGMFQFDHLRDMKDDFGIMPYPKYDASQKDYCGMLERAMCTFGVPVSCADVDRCGAVLEYASFVSHNTLLPAYYETTVKQKRIRNEKDVEMLDAIRNSARLQISEVFSLGITDVLDSAYKKDDLASVYAANQNKLDAAIEKLMGSISD